MTKMGRKISRDNADVYPLHKSLVGIRILLDKQTFAHYTDTTNVIENINDNEEWLNHAICVQHLYALAIEMCMCLVLSSDILSMALMCS